MPTNLKHIRELLHALHETRLLFMIENKREKKLQIVLNTSKLTNEVHKLLFSSEAVKLLKEKYRHETLASYLRISCSSFYLST